jgi:nucleoid DNA-binding protein
LTKLDRAKNSKSRNNATDYEQQAASGHKKLPFFKVGKELKEMVDFEGEKKK